MKLHKYTDTQLLIELNKSKSFCDDLNKALECVPETSTLGRLGIGASLRNETKRYNRLFEEAKRRGLR